MTSPEAPSGEEPVESGDSVPSGGETETAALVLAVGHPFRGDDGVGQRVAAILLSRGLPGVRIVEATGEGTALLRLWKGCSRVAVVDAVVSGLPPGTLHRHDAARGPLPVRPASASSHAFGVAEAIELARVLGELPPSLVVHGVEGREFALGAPLSPPVARACEELAEILAAELAAGAT